MTDKEQIKCKYKFQDKEKFDGKTYCTCFCELCEDLPPCDDNCQIYEDFKQLARKTQECERSRKRISDLEERIINHSNEIEEYCSRLADKNKKCEELKSQIDADYECYSQQLKILRNIIENKEKRNARLFVISNNYRKALEEIEEVADDYNRVGKTSQYYRDGFEQILDIINKAKGEE